MSDEGAGRFSIGEIGIGCCWLAAAKTATLVGAAGAAPANSYIKLKVTASSLAATTTTAEQDSNQRLTDCGAARSKCVLALRLDVAQAN